MMRVFIVFSLFFFVSFSLSAQKTGSRTSNKATLTAKNGGNTAVHQEVKSFGLKIVKSYFDRDCDFLYNSLADEIRSKEGGQIFVKSPELKAGLCAESPLRPDISVNYVMYTQNYQQQVYNSQEFTQAFPQLQSAYQLQEGDYFFNGSIPKAAGSTRVFRASDMASFILRKQGGAWKIIAM